MVVMPRPACRCTASVMNALAWPVIAPVSPRAKSTYSMPSTSTTRAPWASAKKIGNEPGQRVIHAMGTPVSRFLRADALRASERG